MLKGLLPPFRVGERRNWLYQDNIFGASMLEYLGLGVVLGLGSVIIWNGIQLLMR